MCNIISSEGEVKMLGNFQILETTCETLGPIIGLVKGVLSVIQFGIPIVLILLGTIDLGKAVMSSDDKEVKASQGRLIKRFIYAVLVFFVVLLVDLVMGLVDSNKDEDSGISADSWSECWKNS